MLPSMGGAVLASILHVAGRPSPSHCCRPIVVVQLTLSYCCPQNAAVVVINIVSISSGSGILTISITVAVMAVVFAIAIVAVIVDVRFDDFASSSLYRCAFWQPIRGAGQNHSSPNCPHWSIVVLDGWRSTCKHSACHCHPLPSHHCRPIVVVKSPLSNRRPQIAAIIVINIVAVRSSGGIIAIAVAITITVSPISIAAVIINLALSTLLCHCCQMGGSSFLGTYPTYSYVGYLARPLVVYGNECFW